MPTLARPGRPEPGIELNYQDTSRSSVTVRKQERGDSYEPSKSQAEETGGETVDLGS